MTRIAVLGLGEAGGRIAAGLEAAGADVVGYDPALPVGADDARSAVAGCDAVLSVNTAAAARDVAEGVLTALAPGAVFADLNTAAPALKRELCELVGPAFADVALLGPVPARGVRTPALVSGPAAARFARLVEPFGMPVEVVSDRPGDAAARKLLRSVFMKGVAAAAVESLAAAEVTGDADWLRGEIVQVVDGGLLDRFVEGSRVHAVRRTEEMRSAAELLRELGVEPHVAEAAAAVLAGLAAAS